MEVAQYFVGVIDGVRYSPNGTSIVVNGLEYKVSDVFEVVEAKENVSDDEPEPDTDPKLDSKFADKSSGK